ncbi:MAG: tRNA uridine-5-carboxymethylaminomethyl(34) synthesis enzyme MnmG [Thermoanaerobaculales bacterium]|nr:tRNA uridine-5-carboxymethylaminomethyl(34) synthesis enzyme MnmG [Thermoanaerobaculales bacterium]
MAPAYDLVVVGAGHAGCEAAAAAARMGGRVAVVTLHRATIAQMPCNPAMGGIGKGHLMAELDALGGLQGWASDRAGLQFKVLNASRGPAVWGPRAQCDKARYTEIMRRVLERLGTIELIEGEAVGLLTTDSGVAGVRLADGRRVRAATTLLTTGTFLGGVLHEGERRRPGGRHGERPSIGLGAGLKSVGLELRRFKTGTPPRLRRSSLDVTRMETQAGDEPPRPFSFRTRRVTNRVVCWLTRTPEAVQTIIEDNLHRSPLFSGVIDGVGPRYCPSIEDKVVRFPHHREHTVFLEPEGVGTESVYVNGLSTSLPSDVQEAVVHAVPGLENAEFLRHGYAVEYDVVAPGQVGRDLVCREVPGLALAGQVLGTSGYEEAAALGFLAGVNAIRAGHGEGPLVLGREAAYIGVLVDDLVTRDHDEPYRMFTSRAEHRLVLGVDSARERLMGHGVALGLVRPQVFHVEQRRWAARERARTNVESAKLNPDRGTRELLRERVGIELTAPTTWAGVLRRQDVDPGRAATVVPELSGLSDDDRRIVVGTLRYDGYLERHRREIARVERLRHVAIPSELDVAAIPGLSREVVEQLLRHRPTTLAEAEGLPGMTPAAVAILAGRLAAKSGTAE